MDSVEENELHEYLFVPSENISPVSNQLKKFTLFS